jgi:DNA invertase Pin-like site-specific DNA recombinase
MAQIAAQTVEFPNKEPITRPQGFQRTKVGLASARARGRKGGGQYKMTAAKLRLAMAAMGQRQTVVSELCRELGVTRQTLYRHIGPDGSLREDGQKILLR